MYVKTHVLFCSLNSGIAYDNILDRVICYWNLFIGFFFVQFILFVSCLLPLEKWMRTFVIIIFTLGYHIT